VINHYQDLCKTFEAFLENLGHIFCGRCFDEFGNDVRANANYWRHHIGLAYKLCQSEKPVDVNTWFDDLDHGLFHGIMVCFMAQLTSSGSISKKISLSHKSSIHGVSDGDINLWISCLLHDFLKTQGYSQEDHDKLLIEFFPKLDPQTFIHANPTDETHSLVIGDRIELRRYPDFDTWKKDELSYQLEPKIRKLVDLFYNVLRPALKAIMESRKDIWLRHGLENTSVGYARDFPPPGSYVAMSKDKAFPIEIDTFPFNQCSNHGEKDRHPYAAKAKMNEYWPFAEVRGFIPFKKFKSLGGRISNPTQPRDHLYALSEINTKHWIFSYKDYIVNKHPRRGELNHLIKYSKGVVTDRILILFDRVIELITNYFTVLNT